jgi:hypothetical protein
MHLQTKKSEPQKTSNKVITSDKQRATAKKAFIISRDKKDMKAIYLKIGQIEIRKNWKGMT